MMSSGGRAAAFWLVERRGLKNDPGEGCSLVGEGQNSNWVRSQAEPVEGRGGSEKLLKKKIHTIEKFNEKTQLMNHL